MDESSARISAVDPRLLGLRLQEARKERGLTQQDAAQRIGVARTTLTAMEKGERSVRADELVQLAALYGRDVHNLLRRREPVPDFIVQFRMSLSQQNLDNSEVLAVIAEFKQLSEDYLELEALCNAPLPRKDPPPYDVRDVPAEQAGEDVAAAERNRLGLGDGPIGNLRDMLETDVGVRIFCMKMPSRISALLGYTERASACMAINANHPGERQRWSLAHECAHFLTRRYQADVMVLSSYQRVPESERFADSFAKFFLMPSTGLLRRFNELKRARHGAITPADLVKLAHYYEVSFEAITRHLEAQRMLPAGTYEDLVARGFKVREAQGILELSPYPSTCELLPLRYELLAAEAYQKAQISEGEFARFVRLDRLAARERFESLSRNLTLSEQGVGQVGLDLGESLASRSR
ncbi:MAG: ImmA/IrrE family metallo-endopeptidase [Chloroflexi bacterium]|nr:ImmA/IrrE family metallo-endopeptidase [Chloroflexota bacterium]